MPHQCHLIENPTFNSQGNVDTSKRAIGDMWFLDCNENELKERHLTAQYWRDNSNRKPLVVKLPNNDIFCIDSQGWSPEKGHYDCWTVTGIPPLISVTPSINFVGRWHGFLGSNNYAPGVLSDNL